MAPNFIPNVGQHPGASAGIANFLRDLTNVRRINAAIRRALSGRRGGGQTLGRILVVDDDPVVRQMLVHALRVAGHAVVTAPDGREALEVLRLDREVNLLITDIDMQEIDGLEVVAALRRANSPIPILVVSSQNAGDNWAERALELGANKALAKPFDMRELVATVRELIGG